MDGISLRSLGGTLRESVDLRIVKNKKTNKKPINSIILIDKIFRKEENELNDAINKSIASTPKNESNRQILSSISQHRKDIAFRKLNPITPTTQFNTTTFHHACLTTSCVSPPTYEILFKKPTVFYQYKKNRTLNNVADKLFKQYPYKMNTSIPPVKKSSPYNRHINPRKKAKLYKLTLEEVSHSQKTKTSKQSRVKVLYDIVRRINHSEQSNKRFINKIDLSNSIQGIKEKSFYNTMRFIENTNDLAPQHLRMLYRQKKLDDYYNSLEFSKFIEEYKDSMRNPDRLVAKLELQHCFHKAFVDKKK